MWAGPRRQCRVKQEDRSFGDSRKGIGLGGHPHYKGQLQHWQAVDPVVLGLQETRIKWT